jgi:hypothetical protein
MPRGRVRINDPLEKWFCPTVPLSLRDRCYARYGYKYAGGHGQPVAFWKLVKKILDELEDKDKRSVA